MVTKVSCVVAVLIAVVVAAPSAKVRLRRSYSDVGYIFDSVEDASVAGDHVGLIDCSDDDSESIELAYIINKREVPEARATRADTSSQIASTIAPAFATATNYPK
ncbi:hypothetical protein MSG28_010721 [Choristoneura fumiferana]|uniref:Uncharacterized protein n=1 Tax=Choristoneura fumiferana TaxID=7141 RepID=A0ACC0KNH5_CHOFU|nr:hypothetical protein MSG28_010721 [Choristoneura fumiferana]